MPKSITRTYSRYARDAVALIGKLIRRSRKEQQITEQELSTRAGISRGLLQRIEKGDAKCEIGVVFELATLVGIKLFSADYHMLQQHLQQTEAVLALLPSSIRKKRQVVDDDF